MTPISISEQLYAFADLLRPLADQLVTDYPHFVEVEDYFGREFENEGWLCKAHARAFTAKYGGDIVVNCYSPEEEGICCCSECGALLGPFCMTEYGVTSELEHWQGSEIEATPGQYWELLQLVEAVLNSNDVTVQQQVLALMEGLPRAGGVA